MGVDFWPRSWGRLLCAYGAAAMGIACMAVVNGGSAASAGGYIPAEASLDVGQPLVLQISPRGLRSRISSNEDYFPSPEPSGNAAERPGGDWLRHSDPASGPSTGLFLASGPGVGAVQTAPAASADTLPLWQVGAERALIVRNDRGGGLVARLHQIRALKTSGRQVRITGRVCYSTCTMLLGLPQTCISPQTEFGFHAPQRPGRPLDAETFDYASRVIAEYYPAPLKRWYLKTGRYRTRGLYRIDGARLIAMGVPRCGA